MFRFEMDAQQSTNAVALQHFLILVYLVTIDLQNLLGLFLICKLTHCSNPPSLFVQSQRFIAQLNQMNASLQEFWVEINRLREVTRSLGAGLDTLRVHVDSRFHQIQTELDVMYYISLYSDKPLILSSG